MYYCIEKYKHSFLFLFFQLLTAALQLELFDCLAKHTNGAQAFDVATELGLDPAATERLLNVLVAMELLCSECDDGKGVIYNSGF